jgi:hypothetical protein
MSVSTPGFDPVPNPGAMPAPDPVPDPVAMPAPATVPDPVAMPVPAPPDGFLFPPNIVGLPNFQSIFSLFTFSSSRPCNNLHLWKLLYNHLEHMSIIST